MRLCYVVEKNSRTAVEKNQPSLSFTLINYYSQRHNADKEMLLLLSYIIPAYLQAMQRNAQLLSLIFKSVS